jgi:cytochrome c5
MIWRRKQKNKKLKTNKLRTMKIILTISIIILGFFYTQAQTEGEWVVPEEEAAVLSPFEFTTDDAKAGEELYLLNCKSCHGDPGKGNYIALQPPPGDIATDKIQHNTDGAIYYKLKAGRGAMPAFGNVLTPNQKWQVIAYIRSFNEDYVQEVAVEVPETAFGGKIDVLVNYIKDENKLQASFIGHKDGETQPIVGADVHAFAKRKFGKLTIDQVRKTDDKGLVAFNLPDDLPGDSSGYVELSLGLVNMELYGEINKDTLLAFGVPTYLPPLNEERAMWNVRTKAPIWLLITYHGALLIVFGIIFYILLQLRNIYLEGKKHDDD